MVERRLIHERFEYCTGYKYTLFIFIFALYFVAILGFTVNFLHTPNQSIKDFTDKREAFITGRASLVQKIVVWNECNELLTFDKKESEICECPFFVLCRLLVITRITIALYVSFESASFY